MGPGAPGDPAPTPGVFPCSGRGRFPHGQPGAPGLERPPRMSRTVVISQPMFLPWVGLFEQARHADVWFHYDDVQLPQGRSPDLLRVHKSMWTL